MRVTGGFGGKRRTMNASVRRLEEADFKLAERIAQALKGLRYGSIEIVVHDGRVVQFERRERVRLDRNDDRVHEQVHEQ